MFNSGFLFQFEEKYSTLPCCLGPRPGLSASSVWADARTERLGRPSQAARKGCRWELRREELPEAQAPPQSQASQTLEQSPGNGVSRKAPGLGSLTTLLSRRLCPLPSLSPRYLSFYSSCFSNDLLTPASPWPEDALESSSLEICVGFVSSVCT